MLETIRINGINCYHFQLLIRNSELKTATKDSTTGEERKVSVIRDPLALLRRIKSNLSNKITIEGIRSWGTVMFLVDPVEISLEQIEIDEDIGDLNITLPDPAVEQILKKAAKLYEAGVIESDKKAAKRRFERRLKEHEKNRIDYDQPCKILNYDFTNGKLISVSYI